ncbi:MAG TPA: YihA family ribosome biogenesis GTP-binding protein [Firmicutes bacterium]|jgi:GTP-binding protein|nr:YihA family ribosome biogenesis GTP-binding protein [Bacillota bacterium]
MKVKKAELLKLASTKKDFPTGKLPEIVLAGRSNVGKSSLINILLRRRNLARTSNTPGKTRALHFYLVNDSFYFVDLPGYGYARVSQEIQKRWSYLIDDYFSDRSNNVLVILVVDLRHEPSAEDKEMAAWLRHFAYRTIIVATKGDKVPRGKRAKQKQLIAASLEVDPEKIIIFSSKTGEGRDQLLKIIDSELERGRC